MRYILRAWWCGQWSYFLRSMAGYHWRIKRNEIPKIPIGCLVPPWICYSFRSQVGWNWYSIPIMISYSFVQLLFPFSQYLQEMTNNTSKRWNLWCSRFKFQSTLSGAEDGVPCCWRARGSHRRNFDDRPMVVWRFASRWRWWFPEQEEVRQERKRCYWFAGTLSRGLDNNTGITTEFYIDLWHFMTYLRIFKILISLQQEVSYWHKAKIWSGWALIVFWLEITGTSLLSTSSFVDQQSIGRRIYPQP